MGVEVCVQLTIAPKFRYDLVKLVRCTVWSSERERERERMSLNLQSDWSIVWVNTAFILLHCYATLYVFNF